jgi:hypothetical protein
VEFIGTTRVLDDEGLQRSLDVLNIGAAELWAVIGVETSGCGFLPDRRVKILFERHVFSRLTEHRFDDADPSISDPVAGGYGTGGAAQYERLARAIAFNRTAALQSCSWGIGQVMGYHAHALGYGTAEAMIDLMCDSESAQLEAMARFIDKNGLAARLRARDWTNFARGYNGPAYQINNYDIRLSSTYQKLISGGMPDLVVRSAQAYLTFLGYDPRGIDGVMGRMTRGALNEFQSDRGLAITTTIDEVTLAALRKAAVV